MALVVLPHDLRVSGTLKAGNIASGLLRIVPTPNTPTSMAVTGLNLAGAGAVRAWATANTLVPGSTVVEVSVSDPTSTGFTVVVYRTNDTVTLVRWIAIRDRE
ncbi:hypothetical protein BJF83_20910 [Nocardiopsis sp. CNR-923]|uniref:hypothetical protein n=1 Tax=Nocardiopsis sp. CNR-923 TaxID=1904965 RepID=UPI00095E921E|nr:hypothetical protein [Nocardiopsis sp. CNR-923]OLT26548.1 hypothetical protein BJF83_20910 [Nocardiopsis sp. CNR-923]